MNRKRRMILLTAGSVLAMSVLAPVAGATPPDHVLVRAREAVAIGQEKAMGMALEAPGQENRAKGLERAAVALAAAAERAAERAEGATPGNGNAFGKGHAAEVHAILLAGGSPSDLPSHGEAVSGLAKAFGKVKGDHPGLGLGLDKPSKGNDGDDD